MPRRIYTYPEDSGWGPINMVTSIGAFILALGFSLVLIDVLVSRKHGAVAGPNPWNAPTLEWLTSSPPPPYNFVLIPAVASRHPLWEEQLREGSGHSMLDRGFALDEEKETLATTIVDGIPDVILKMPKDSPWPFPTTIVMSAFFTAMLLKSFIVMGICIALALLCVLFWLWPKRKLLQIASPQNG